MDITTQRLERFLSAIVDGKRSIRSIEDSKQLITAICSQPDRLQRIAGLYRNENGFKAAKKALCMDLSDDSLNNQAAQFILYFAVDDLSQINGGIMLCDLLAEILKPPLLWDAYKTAFTKYRLTSQGTKAFASLIAELMKLLSPASELAVQLDLKAAARQVIDSKQLHDSGAPDVRRLAYKIEELIRCSSLSDGATLAETFKPGGRHDNDFEDFRKISIFPSKDELLSEELPYMLSIDNVMNTTSEQRVIAHLDNQFRMLREDMLAELREDLKDTLVSKGPKRRGLRLRSLQLSGIECGVSKALRPATIALRCFDHEFRKLPENETLRKNHFSDNKSFIKHGAFGCLVTGSEIIAFATIDRDEDLLAKVPSILLLRVFGEAAVRRALLCLKLKKPHEVDFVVVDTPYFAYEPVLTRLQTMPSLPLADVMLGLEKLGDTAQSPFGLEWLADAIKSLEGQDLSSLLGTPKSVCLDWAQTSSLVAGLVQRVSQIQGPPGTGKSFIGAILTKLLLSHVPGTTILVLCYTNHALDQFLEDMLDMGVPEDVILRLGSKSTARTEAMSLQNQSRDRVRMPQAEWQICQRYKNEADETAQRASDKGFQFSKWRHTDMDILESLEFSVQDEHFFHALSTPESIDGMAVVGADGKAISSTYMFQRWVQGKDAGAYKSRVGRLHQDVWSMSRAVRQEHYARWMRDAISERGDLLTESMKEHDRQFWRWKAMKDNRISELMKTKRIISCTTTAAAKYADQISLAKPGIVLVEEAGEVLESHILTALFRETKQLIMIGDHHQLRPKVKNYALTVERGDGFDLNRSLFERLILGGHPHTVLTKQHRMRPQISALVRRLMYPELQDGESVTSRPDMLGLQQNVVFIDHSNYEVSDGRIRDRQDGAATVSRQNVYEAKMILKIVKYLAQQGYGTDKQVVLTPYLGQLRLIMDELKKDEHDPVLSDLDSHDLVKAGLLTPASAKQQKRPLRISTVGKCHASAS